MNQPQHVKEKKKKKKKRILKRGRMHQEVAMFVTCRGVTRNFICCNEDELISGREDKIHNTARSGGMRSLPIGVTYSDEGRGGCCVWMTYSNEGRGGRWVWMTYSDEERKGRGVWMNVFKWRERRALSFNGRCKECVNLSWT